MNPQEGNENQIKWYQWFLAQPVGKVFLEVDPGDLNASTSGANLGEYRKPNDVKIEELMKSDPKLTREKCLEQIQTNDLHLSMEYGVAHALFLASDKGQKRMIARYKAECALPIGKRNFPECPRKLCQHTVCFPCGLPLRPGIEHEANQTNLKLYCPRCNDLYEPPNPILRGIDGSSFKLKWLPNVLVALDYELYKKPFENFVFIPTIMGIPLHEKPISKDSQAEQDHVSLEQFFHK